MRISDWSSDVCSSDLVKLSPAAEALLDDLENDTVDFQPNYDDKSREPTVLPARFPKLLVNGAGGIAAGMATKIGRASCRESVCLYVEISVVAVKLKKKGQKENVIM